MSPSRWSAYRPSASAPWDLARVWTLRRRAGFAATWAELQRDLKSGPDAAVDRILDGIGRIQDILADFASTADLLGDTAAGSGDTCPLCSLERGARNLRGRWAGLGTSSRRCGGDHGIHEPLSGQHPLTVRRPEALRGASGRTRRCIGAVVRSAGALRASVRSTAVCRTESAHDLLVSPIPRGLRRPPGVTRGGGMSRGTSPGGSS
jgi:hypothetical protein